MIPKAFSPDRGAPAEGVRSTSMTVYSLPEEILALIFRLASSCSIPSISQRNLLSVTHVCARWRRLALMLGELWMYLSIAFPITGQELSRAKEWVRRSSPYPLKIVIDVRDPDWDFNEELHPVKWLEMQAAMSVILPAAERWRKLEISADNWEPLHAFLHHTQKILVPILQNVHLIRCNPYFAAPGQIFIPSNSKTFLPLFGGLQLDELTSVKLDGVHVDWTSPALRGLTELSLGYHARDVIPTLVQFRDMLNSCPELESFILTGWGPIIDDDLSASGELQRFRSSVTLPRLRFLEIGIMIPMYAVEVLSLLVVPLLESLTIDDITRYDPQALMTLDFGPVFNFLAGQTSPSRSTAISMQQLSTLTITNLDPGEIPFHRFLESLQNLRVLYIRNCTAAALRALAPGSISIPCQRLEKLCVEACDTSILTDVVSSRRTASHDLDVTFQLDANNSQFPLSPATAKDFVRLDIRILPFQPVEGRQWRNSEIDDSEALVSAILEERWDVAGTVI